jgi:hypothetical protein
MTTISSDKREREESRRQNAQSNGGAFFFKYTRRIWEMKSFISKQKPLLKEQLLKRSASLFRFRGRSDKDK